MVETLKRDDKLEDLGVKPTAMFKNNKEIIII